MIRNTIYQVYISIINSFIYIKWRLKKRLLITYLITTTVYMIFITFLKIEIILTIYSNELNRKLTE